MPRQPLCPALIVPSIRGSHLPGGRPKKGQRVAGSTVSQLACNRLVDDLFRRPQHLKDRRAHASAEVECGCCAARFEMREGFDVSVRHIIDADLVSNSRPVKGRRVSTEDLAGLLTSATFGS
jgi:hypothetical protein